MAEYHPTDDMILGYASGSLSEGLSLLMASHLTYCAECRQRVEKLESLGGAMLSAMSVPNMTPPAFDDILARLGPQDPAPGIGATSTGATGAQGNGVARPAQAMASTVLPAAIRDRIGGSEAEISWRFRMPGLSEHVISTSETESVSLLRARPGARMLAHTHHGDEATLIFSGEMRDGDRVYRRGDVAIADEADDHRPEIVGEETCYCLIVMSGSMQFTGRLGKVLNLFHG
ncbi:MAG: ChrR family anti-sigma-E factor [Pseudomonadota bacterium]